MAWDVFSDFERQFNEMERQLSDLRQRLLGSAGGQATVPQLGGGREGGSMDFGMGARAQRMPTVDIVDEGREFVVTADVPGVGKDDIDVNVSGNQLTIRAETRRERDEGGRGQGYVRQERSFTRYYRTLTLPEEVKSEEVRAKYKNGVLEIRLPKQEGASHGRRVQID